MEAAYAEDGSIVIRFEEGDDPDGVELRELAPYLKALAKLANPTAEFVVVEDIGPGAAPIGIVLERLCEMGDEVRPPLEAAAPDECEYRRAS